MASFSEKQIADFKETFSLVDEDSDGLIDAAACMNVLRSCGQLPPQSLLKDIKPTLDFPDFLSLISRLGAHPVDSEEKEVREAFTTFDPERTGTVSLQQLKKVLSNVGERLTPDELDDFVKEIGETKDGRIAIDDCVRVLTNRV